MQRHATADSSTVCMADGTVCCDVADVNAGRYESSDKLMSLVKHAESDAWLSLGLCFYLNVLPLTRQLSNLSGSLWSKALQGQRAQRIEMLLLHEFHKQKFMLPDKLSIKVIGGVRLSQRIACVAVHDALKNCTASWMYLLLSLPPSSFHDRSDYMTCKALVASHLCSSH